MSLIVCTVRHSDPTEVIKLIMNEGVDVNYCCPMTKINVLQRECAQFGGRYSVVKLLIDYGVNVDHKNQVYDISLVLVYKNRSP